MKLIKGLELLGFKVKDTVTGFTGVVTSISFDLYGCVQAIVSPGLDKKTGTLAEVHWFDTKRLQVLGTVPVMSPPTFEVVPGGQSLPAYPSKPKQ